MKKINIIISAFLMIFFLIWTFLVSSGYTVSFDKVIYEGIIKFRCDFLDSFFKFITVFGNINTIFFIACLFLIIKRNKDALLLSVISVICPTVMYIIKSIIKRQRPTILQLIDQGGYSFPSGHAMIAVCVYGYFIYYFYRHVKNKCLRNFVCTFLVIFILLIGISRIYLGVHYPSDILGGYLISSIILIIIIDSFKIINSKE